MPRPVDALVEDPRLHLEEASVARLIHSLDTAPGAWRVPPGGLAVAFVDEATCARLHEEFFGDPSVTDVMTFPGDEEEDHAGDIAICPAHAARQAPAFGEEFAAELSLYLVHAWLHLAGLDDRAEADRAEMRAAEALLTRHLREGGHLLEARWTT
jgi:probable rRNA maturation factor